MKPPHARRSTSNIARNEQESQQETTPVNRTPVFDTLRATLTDARSSLNDALSDDDLTGTLRLLHSHACRDRNSTLYSILGEEALEIVLERISDEIYSLVSDGDVARDETWPILLGHNALRTSTSKAPFLSSIVESCKAMERRAKDGLEPAHKVSSK